MLKFAALLLLAAAAAGATTATRRPLQAGKPPASVLDVIKADPQTSDLYGFVQQVTAAALTHRRRDGRRSNRPGNSSRRQ